MIFHLQNHHPQCSGIKLQASQPERTQCHPSSSAVTLALRQWTNLLTSLKFGVSTPKVGITVMKSVNEGRVLTREHKLPLQLSEVIFFLPNQCRGVLEQGLLPYSFIRIRSFYVQNHFTSPILLIQFQPHIIRLY